MKDILYSVTFVLVICYVFAKVIQLKSWLSPVSGYEKGYIIKTWVFLHYLL
jgi:hypothetical protein